MSQREVILAILAANGIDPEKRLEDGNTAFSKLEAAVMGALDEIEE